MKKIWLLLILVTIVIFSVTGCGSGHWVKPDMTEQQFKIDSYECERDSYNAAHTVRHGGLYRRCMESKGYKLVR
jgi:hypothetical protein